MGFVIRKSNEPAATKKNDPGEGAISGLGLGMILAIMLVSELNGHCTPC